MESDDEATVCVLVCCGSCLHRFGDGTVLGEITRERTYLGETRWTWAPMVRAHRPGRERHRSFFVGDQQRAGGIQRACRRCPHIFRSRVSKLPALVARSRLSLDEGIWVGEIYV